MKNRNETPEAPATDHHDQHQLFGDEEVRRLRALRQYVSKRTAALNRLDEHAAEIHLLAEMLVQDFRQTRIALRDLELGRRADVALRKGEEPSNRLFSEIQIFSRLKGGALEIYWQQVERVVRRDGTVKEKFTYIRRGGQERYNQGRLNQYALRYERELVREVEHRAALLRREWAASAVQRRIGRVLQARAIEQTLLAPPKLELPSGGGIVTQQPRAAE